jgi:hypothetical protein
MALDLLPGKLCRIELESSLVKRMDDAAQPLQPRAGKESSMRACYAAERDQTAGRDTFKTDFDVRWGSDSAGAPSGVPG